MTCLPGNNRTKERIWKDIDSLPHAILFSGPKGTGKYEFCMEIAHKLLPESSRVPPELVLVDKLYMEGVQKDVIELSRFSTFDQSHRKKEKKKSDTLGIEDVHAFTKHLHETVEGLWKIVLVRDIERMTIPASNTFLKILEEPPQKTLFLMTTSSPSRILPTVFSRCRNESFVPLSQEEEQLFLEHSAPHLSLPEQKQLLDWSQGRIALLHGSVHDMQFREFLQEQSLILSQLKKASPLERIAIAESFAKKSLGEILDFLSSMELSFRKSLSDNFDLVEFFDELDTVRIALQGNGNKKLLLEQLFLSIPT